MKIFRRRNQVTVGGLAFLALTVVIFTAAFNSASNNLYIIFGMMIGVFLAAWLLTRRAFRRLEVQRVLPEHAVAGEAAEIGYRIKNGRRVWPVFALQAAEFGLPFAVPEAFFAYVAPRNEEMATARITPPRRGLLRLETIRLKSSFPLGLLVRLGYRDTPAELVVYPRAGVLHRKIAVAYREAVDSGAMTSSRRGGNDEFYGLREYRPGDNIRAIHWRSTARTNELMVRELTAHAPPQLILLVYLTAKTAAADVEKAIELAATVACDAFLENYAISLAVPGLHAEVPLPTMGRGARAELLRQLALLDAVALKAGLRMAPATRMAGRAHYVVITADGGGSAGGGWREYVPMAAAAHATVLALDHPDAGTWVHHLGASHSAKVLRSRKQG